MKKIFLTSMLALISLGIINAQDMKTIKLDAPRLNEGKLLMQALKERKSVREFSDKELAIAQLSDLLWAANGISRDDGRRTAPSALNVQDIDLYVILKDGVYFYDAVKNELAPVAGGDFRAKAGMQDYVATAPVNVILVSDQKKMERMGPDEAVKNNYSYASAGFVSQNIYLYCTSAGLASVVRASIDKEVLAKVLKLRPEQKIILGHTVGYPK